MLNQMSYAIITVLLGGVAAMLAGFALVTACVAVRHLFRPCYTVRADGTPSGTIDSFHLRTWLIGLGIPSYRRTALVGLGQVLFLLAVAGAAGFLAFLVGIGLV